MKFAAPDFCPYPRPFSQIAHSNTQQWRLFHANILSPSLAFSGIQIERTSASELLRHATIAMVRLGGITNCNLHVQRTSSALHVHQMGCIVVLIIPRKIWERRHHKTNFADEINMQNSFMLNRLLLLYNSHQAITDLILTMTSHQYYWTRTTTIIIAITWRIANRLDHQEDV